MSLSAAKTPPPLDAAQEPRHRASLFKEDRPRRIDRVISFFGDDDRRPQSHSESSLFDTFGSEPWSER